MWPFQDIWLHVFPPSVSCHSLKLFKKQEGWRTCRGRLCSVEEELVPLAAIAAFPKRLHSVICKQLPNLIGLFFFNASKSGNFRSADCGVFQVLPVLYCFSQVICVRRLQLGEEKPCMMIQIKSEGKLGQHFLSNHSQQSIQKRGFLHHSCCTLEGDLSVASWEKHYLKYRRGYFQAKPVHCFHFNQEASFVCFSVPKLQSPQAAHAI